MVVKPEQENSGYQLSSDDIRICWRSRHQCPDSLAHLGLPKISLPRLLEVDWGKVGGKAALVTLV